LVGVQPHNRGLRIGPAICSSFIALPDKSVETPDLLLMLHMK
jgi:hypothetical protein